MSEYQKFLPEGIPDSHLPFWDSLRDHRASVQRCDDCGTYRYIPKYLCPRCHGDRSTWTPISGAGEVYSYTVVRRAPTPAYQADAPYVLAHVTMAEGFRMVARLAGAAPDAVRIGLPVVISYEDVTPEWTLVTFRPATPVGEPGAAQPGAAGS
jgi:uncharacterized protein